MEEGQTIKMTHWVDERNKLQARIAELEKKDALSNAWEKEIFANFEKVISRRDAWAKRWKEKAKGLRQLSGYLDEWKGSEISRRNELLRKCWNSLDRGDASACRRLLQSDPTMQEILKADKP